MQNRPYERGRLARTVACCLAFVAAMLSTACVPPPGDKDYRDVYTLKPERKTFSAVVHLNAEGLGAGPNDERQLASIIREYIRRGDSLLLIGSPAKEEGGEDGTTELLLARLAAAGVARESIRLEAGMVAPSAGEGTPFVLSFRGYHVQVPECGDWSGQTGFNPSNQPHTNFGCSFQRNLGLTLSDPGDLVRSRTPGSQDPNRGDDILRKHRVGKPTESEVPKATKDSGGGN